MSKFVIAMVLFAVLEFLAWQTLTDEKIRIVAMLIVGMFAFRTWAHHRREALANAQDKAGSERE